MNPLLLKLLGALGIALAGAGVAHWIDKAFCDRAALRVEVTQQKDVLAFLQEARAQEIASKVATNRIAEAYEKGKTDAQANAETIVAGLKSGALRLQSRWNACQADLSKAGATAAELADEIRSRAESAGRIIAAAELCDRQVEGLQSYAREVSR